MKFALLFPGQGSQKVGMGLDIYEYSKIAKDLFNKINTITGRKISDIFLYGPEEELNQTKNTQLAIVSISIALTLILQEEFKSNKIEFKPFACCGHSLGELTALWYLNLISVEGLIKLVTFRGSLMQDAPSGAMAAVLNLSYDQIKELIEKEKLSDKVIIANHNSPVQFVISGIKEALENSKSGLLEKIKALGGKAIILPVSGGFHSPLMENPAKLFSSEIDKSFLLSSAQSKIPIYQNYDGEPGTECKIIIEKFKNQMISPVLWTQTINNLVKDGVNAVIEIGPGKVLTGLVKKINPNIGCYNILDLTSLKDFINNYEHKFIEAKSI